MWLEKAESSAKDNLLKVWTKITYRCAEVTNVLNTVSLLSNSDDNYKKSFAGRIKRDNDDFEKVQTWFRSHNSFKVGVQHVDLDSGLFVDNNSVTCDRSEEIWASIQAEHDVETFARCSFKRKEQIRFIQTLYTCVKNSHVTTP